jgi:hypothetical protein
VLFGRVAERSTGAHRSSRCEIETLTPADELEARKRIEAEEAAEFITRQVLERDATFFDG